ncbi:DUF4190 domain-containing protein [Crossiella sp. CA-258035]|uniref:DUF4190 domain-containing protein n=1 Tax=Crossiella sp. CA-258035 TaxID=2981138 RepID=UPI0024BC02A1|nr:DUF4190 domain-containing protein [Crossiella sp. CA-258035]WHT17160.1 DUF4190 domain-containing protein [Crossiella sp. CA-258035]
MTDQPQPEQQGQPGQQPSPAQFYPSAPPPPPEAPPGYPGYPNPGYPQPPKPANTNGFAIATLVLGILPIILTNILAVIFGIISLRQIKQRGDNGKGMAIAGLVLGSAWLLLLTFAVVVAINTRAVRDEAGQVSEPGRLTVLNLKVGDCFDGIKESKSISSVTAQPCGSPHEAEVMDRWDMAGGSTYPGEATITDDIAAECDERMTKMLPEAELAKVEIFYFYPTASSWRTGDRTAVCVVAGANKTKLTQKMPRR